MDNMTLDEQRDSMIEYLEMKVRVQDWHGVMDAAADLREIEAEIKGRKEPKVVEVPIMPFNYDPNFHGRGVVKSYENIVKEFQEPKDTSDDLFIDWYALSGKRHGAYFELSPWEFQQFEKWYDSVANSGFDTASRPMHFLGRDVLCVQRRT